MKSTATSPIVLERGVRQGCPLSALLFFLAIELLLCSVDNSIHIRGFVQARSLAYADDITFLVDKLSIVVLFDTVKEFFARTQLEFNVKRSQIPSTNNIHFYKTVRSTKDLGIIFPADKLQSNLLGLLKTQIAIYRHFSSKNSESPDKFYRNIHFSKPPLLCTTYRLDQEKLGNYAEPHLQPLESWSENEN